MPFEARIDRVKKIPNPLLVIGLGGTGASAVKTIKNTFRQSFELPLGPDNKPLDAPVGTEYLVIDSDQTSAEGLENREFINIRTGDLEQILASSTRQANLRAYEQSWIHKDLKATSSGLGAGTIRQGARLMLFRKSSDIIATLTEKAKRLVSTERGSVHSDVPPRMEIVIATGICGGTGSGTFLDIAQFVHHVLRQSDFTGKDYHITGYIVMPDVSLQQTGQNAALYDIWKANGFAALKELDFWMTNEPGEHAVYTQRYNDNLDIAWNRAPFHQCILLSGTDMNNNKYTSAYGNVMKTMAENLLHYMAEEDTGDANRYTYMQHEDNVAAAVKVMNKRFPLGYAYRAVGAYTKHLPRRSALRYEALMLMETFIPPRNPEGQLLPNTPKLSDGKMILRAEEIADDLNTMHKNYQQQAPFPDFCRAFPKDKTKMDTLRRMNPAPHDQAYAGARPWGMMVSRPKAEEYAAKYYAAAWGRFADFCQNVIGNSEEGPHALHKYLTDANGLTMHLDNVLFVWAGKRDAMELGKANAHKAVNNNALWSSFMNPPMIQLGKSVQETYMDLLNAYYGQVRAFDFADEVVKALGQLTERIRHFTNNSLRSLCSLLETAQSLCVKDEINNAESIIDINELKPMLRERFNRANQENYITNALMAKLGELALDFTVDPSIPGGVRWSVGMPGLEDAVVEALKPDFKAVNSQSADAIMEQIYDDDQDAKFKYMDELAKSITQNAVPMFLQAGGMQDESSVGYTYLSMPADSPQHLDRFRETLSANTARHLSEPKVSSISDHIYCLNSNDGLPLYRYSLMPDMEATYERMLMLDQHPYWHIVQTGRVPAAVTNDWSLFPSPRPYYLFADKGGEKAKTAKERAYGVLERALRSGQLTINTNTDSPVHSEITYTLRTFYEDARKQTPSSGAGISVRVKETMDTKAAIAEKRAKLDALLGSADIDGPHTCLGRPEDYAQLLGIEGGNINPWDPAVLADPGRLAQAKENFAKLSKEHVFCALSLKPYLLERILLQAEGFDALTQAMAGQVGKEEQWVVLNHLVRDVSDMVLYGVVEPSMSGYTYRHSEEAVRPVWDVNNPEVKLPPDDINFMKLVRVLSGMPETAPVRRMLMRQLGEARMPEAEELLRKNIARRKAVAGVHQKAIEREIDRLDYDPPTSMDTDTIGRTREVLVIARDSAKQFLANLEIIELTAM